MRAIICRKVQVRSRCPCRVQWVQLLRWEKSRNRLWRASGVEYTWLAEGASGIAGLQWETRLTSSSSTIYSLNATSTGKSFWYIITQFLSRNSETDRSFRHRKPFPVSLETGQGNYFPDKQWLTAISNNTECSSGEIFFPVMFNNKTRSNLQHATSLLMPAW